MEQEIKLLVDPAHAAAVLRTHAVAQVARGPAKSERLVSIYYDTPDHRLKQRRVALRLRREGRRWIQTVKGQGEVLGGLHSRAELEWPVAGEAPDFSLLKPTAFHKLFKRGLRDKLAPVFRTDMLRRSIQVELSGGAWAELSLDRGEIRAGRRREALCEVEIELTRGSPSALFEFAQALLRELPLEVGQLSKAERGYRLLDGGSAEPLKATPLTLDVEEPALRAFGKLVRACSDHARGNEAGFLGRSDPEYLHQLRVALRRMRAVLLLPRAGPWREALAPLQSDLKWLWQVLGEARDWDVLEQEVIARLRSRDGPAVKELGRCVARLRQQALSEARAAVSSTRYHALWLSLGALMSRSDLLAGLQGEAAPFAAAVLDRRWRKVRRWGEPLPGAAASLHRLRIETKKLRYVGLSFAGLYPGKRERRFLASLSEVQDLLGTINDADAALKLIARAAGPTEKPGVVAAVALATGWVQAKRHDARLALPRAWKKFSAQPPYWD